MSDTAVGLFAHLGAANAVVDALTGIGFPSDGVRILTGTPSGSVDSPTSTPQIDFEAALARDLRSMGATESECDLYLEGLRDGEVLVFATGTAEQANLATVVMKEYEAVEVEEFVGAVSSLPGAAQGFSTGAHSISAKEDRVRAKTTGAKIFSW